MTTKQSPEAQGMNRAKAYQLALFPMNNGATNVYFVLVLAYVLNFGSGVMAMAAIFVSFVITGMRVFDAVLDPFIGSIIDRTNGKFGKFRPYMVLGNLTMTVGVLCLYILTPLIPESNGFLRYAAFILFYFIWVVGYTLQTTCTRSAQSVLTNDPKQRPMFTMFNTVGSLIGMGSIQFLAPVIGKMTGGYNTTAFFSTMTPVGIIVSMALTALAVIGIWEKDQPKYFGIAKTSAKRSGFKDYFMVVKENKPIRRLMLAGASCKLALAIATHTAVLCMLYGAMMGNYDGLYLPMMVLGYVFSAPFFGLTITTSQKKGQKAALQKYVGFAFLMYIGVLALLFFWRQGDPNFNLSLFVNGGFSTNLYTLLFILFFGLGYGAYYSTADMAIPMGADCSDYETYKSGKFIPGTMGSLLGLVDKLVSSIASLVVTVATLFIGLKAIPDQYTPYAPGMNWVVMVLFCVIPMLAWLTTLFSMKGYALSGPVMKEVQRVNAERKAAIAQGMSLEESMKKFRASPEVEEALKI